MAEDILGIVMLALDLRETISQGDVNAPDENGRTLLDQALDLADFQGDRLYGYTTCEDPLVQLIISHGGEPSISIYLRELDEQLGWAEHHYGCHCRMPFQHWFCK